MTPSVAIDYYSSAGYRLRSARERSSLSIRDVADAANLLATHVRAIEANRCDALAHDERFLRRLRDYASLVDLDENEVVDSYRAQSTATAEPILPLPAESKQRRSGIWFGVGALLLVCVCFGTWLLNQTSPSKSGNNATPGNEKAEGVQTQAQAQPGRDRKALTTGVENAAADGVPTEAANAVSAPSASSREETLTPAGINALPANKTAAPPDHAAGEPQQKQNSTAPATAPGGAMQTPASRQLRSTEWFASLAPDRYTLQVLSLTKERSTRAFIQRRNLEDEAAYFAVRKDDKTLYAVTYGLYDSYQAAEAASKSLPESIKDLKPWVRNTGRIQQSMQR